MAKLPRDAPVLIIDDSAAIRSRMESYLDQLGFENILTAATLEEGLTTFKKSEPPVVFLDLVIDEERGVDFAAEALNERPFTNIVIMTALPSSHEYVTAAVAEGARDFLPKPFTFQTVKSVIDRLEETLTRDERAGARVEDASYL